MQEHRKGHVELIQQIQKLINADHTLIVDKAGIGRLGQLVANQRCHRHPLLLPNLLNRLT